LNKKISAREAGGSAVARFTGSIFLIDEVLGLAPQALCFRPLRGLTIQINCELFHQLQSRCAG